MQLQIDIDAHKKAAATAAAAMAAQARPRPAPAAAPMPQVMAPVGNYAPFTVPQPPHAWPAAAAPTGWGEFRDPNSGHAYYYNALTGESSWVKPLELSAAAFGAPRPPMGRPPAAAAGASAQGQKGPPGANLFVARPLRRGEGDGGFDTPQLRQTFEAFGVVTRAEMSFDKATGQNKGFGFISFARVEDADRAIASLQGQFIMGKPIRIEKTKEDGAPPASQVPAAGAWGAMPMHPAMMQQTAAYPGYPPAGAMRF
jgi:hypothetical protein